MTLDADELSVSNKTTTPFVEIKLPKTSLTPGKASPELTSKHHTGSVRPGSTRTLAGSQTRTSCFYSWDFILDQQSLSFVLIAL